MPGRTYSAWKPVTSGSVQFRALHAFTWSAGAQHFHSFGGASARTALRGQSARSPLAAPLALRPALRTERRAPMQFFVACSGGLEKVKVISENRKARFNYEILEKYEAGISLTGTEIKSVRSGRMNMQDCFARVTRTGEVELIGMHISPHHTTAAFFNHEAKRKRMLLLHKREIRKIRSQAETKGLSLVPTKAYLKGQLLKIELAVARGKKLHDKRETLKKKADKRDVQRALKNY